MERIFINGLKKQLKQRIKGTISAHIINNTLIVDIVDGVFQCWKYTLCNISMQLASGLSSRIVADVITKEYKKYILSIHFYTK